MDYASALSVVGGLILSAAYPLLLSRILVRGNAGISTTSQVLHSVALLLRYAGICLEKAHGDHQGTFSEWIWLKLYLIPASVLILVSMRYRTGGAQNTSSKQRLSLVSIVKESSIYITLSFLLGYRINYGSFSWSDSWSSHTSSLSWLSLVAQYISVKDLVGINAHDASEIMWAASIFLAGVAGIPQYITYYRHVTHMIDKLLMSVVAMTSLGSLFCTPLWVAGFTEINYIALTGATFQAFAFWMFFVLVVTKVNDGDSDLLEDPEAQLEEYDTSRWGGEVFEPSRFRRSRADGGGDKLITLSGDDDI